MPFGADICTLNEYLRTWDVAVANDTIDSNARVLTEHRVQFLAEWVIAAFEPRVRLPKCMRRDFLFLREKDFWFKRWTYIRPWYRIGKGALADW